MRIALLERGHLFPPTPRKYDWLYPPKCKSLAKIRIRNGRAKWHRKHREKALAPARWWRPARAGSHGLTSTIRPSEQRRAPPHRHRSGVRKPAQSHSRGNPVKIGLLDFHP